MKPPKHVFATFPKFSKLTLADREKWEELIKDYPPISMFSFQTLMTWWNELGSLRVAQLNNNLVISYWLPGDDIISGLSLIGRHRVDESLCTIFDWQKEQNDQARVVHVPEVVISNIRYPDIFDFEPNRNGDECVLRIDNLASFQNLPGFCRPRLKRLFVDIEEKSVVVQKIDLSLDEEKCLVKGCVNQWTKSVGFNSVGAAETERLFIACGLTDRIGLECAGLFIEGVLEAFILYSIRQDIRYSIVHFGRFNYDVSHVFELAVYKFAQFFADEGVKFANIESDLGLRSLRSAKLLLRPHNFFRKYTIIPKT